MKEQCDDGERTEKTSRAFRGKEGRGRTELIGSKITGEDRGRCSLILLWLASFTGPPFRKLMRVSPLSTENPINLQGDSSNRSARDVFTSSGFVLR